MSKKTAKSNTVKTAKTAKKEKSTMKPEVKTAAKTNTNPEPKPEPVKEAAPVEQFALKEWYDKNLGALDCEQCAWTLTQTITSLKPDDKMFGHVHSDGKRMYASNGRALVILTAPVMPSGVYDPVLAGKGRAKRRAFIPVNLENFAAKMRKVEEEAKQEKTLAFETFDFSINAPLNAETFALQYFLAVAGKGVVISDEMLSLVTASCQMLTCKIGAKYTVFSNDILMVVFQTIHAGNGKYRVLDTIRKYNSTALPPAPEKEIKK